MFRGLMSTIRGRWVKHFIAWSHRRQKVAGRYTLRQKNLYIFPSKTGWSFITLALIIWLIGTNYQNNIILALGYLLVSLFVVAILNTYYNLAGLKITNLSARSCHVGETLSFKFQIDNERSQTAYNLVFSVQLLYEHSGIEEPLSQSCFLEQAPKGESHAQVDLSANQRGRCKPKNVLVKSSFPMGLFNCWSWLRFDDDVVVYPAATYVVFPQNKEQQAGEEGDHASINRSGDDFMGYHEYRPGDPIKAISWKHVASEQGVYVKDYGESEQFRSHIHLNDFKHSDVEKSLEYMTYWVLEFYRLEVPFCMTLSEQYFPPDTSSEHLRQALTALATYEHSV